MNKEGELLLAGFFRSFQVTRAGRSIGDEEWCFLRGEERSNVTRKSNLRSDPSRVTVKFYFFFLPLLSEIFPARVSPMKPIIIPSIEIHKEKEV